MNKTISVIGIPMWLGQARYGTNLAPDVLRGAGLFEQLTAASLTWVDEGNITVGMRRSTAEHNMKNFRQLVNASQAIFHKVTHIVDKQNFPLILGGDHSISIGTLAGIAKHYANLGVIWFDAHADINTPETSPSGNIHGMPLAASMGYGHSSLTGIGQFYGKVKPQNIVIVGARDIDPGERELIDREGIKVYTTQDIEKCGMQNIITETLAYLTARCDGIHLSFDLDGIDPIAAPGVGTPVEQGVSYSDAQTAVSQLAQSGRITSAEFVELNPLLDPSGQTAASAIELIGSLLGGVAQHKAVQKKQLYPTKRTAAHS